MLNLQLFFFRYYFLINALHVAYTNLIIAPGRLYPSTRRAKKKIISLLSAIEGIFFFLSLQEKYNNFLNDHLRQYFHLDAQTKKKMKRFTFRSDLIVHRILVYHLIENLLEDYIILLAREIYLSLH